MNTFAMTLILGLLFSLASFATLASKSSCIATPPTKLARYQTSAYLSGDGTKLRVNVDKQPGGRIYIHLKDPQGNLYFNRMLRPAENGIRLKLDLTALADGEYLLTVSNGLEKVVRTVLITSAKPTIAPRSITML